MASAARKLDLIDVAPFSAADAAAMEARFAGIGRTRHARRIADRRVERSGCSGVFFRRRERGAAAPDRANRPRYPRHLPQHAEDFRRDPTISRRAFRKSSGFTDLRVFRPDPRLLATKDANGACAGITIPTAAATCARSSPCAAHSRRSMRGCRGARAFRRGHAKRCRASKRMRAASNSTRSPIGTRWHSTVISPSTTCRAIRSRRKAMRRSAARPCTSKVLPGEDPRAGRWRGWEKVECGIHVPEKPGEEPVF